MADKKIPLLKSYNLKELVEMSDEELDKLKFSAPVWEYIEAFRSARNDNRQEERIEHERTL